MNEIDINWRVFTEEEHQYLNTLMRLGAWDSISSAVRIDDPEKEFQLQQIINKYKPVGQPLESGVRAEMLEALKKGEQIDSPEKEAEWQEKLDAEQAEHEAKVKAKNEPKVKKEEVAAEEVEAEPVVEAVTEASAEVAPEEKSETTTEPEKSEEVVMAIADSIAETESAVVTETDAKEPELGVSPKKRGRPKKVS